MFLLGSVGSVDTKKDSFNKSLKPLLSRHRIVKLFKRFTITVEDLQQKTCC